MGGNGKQRWKISLTRASKPDPNKQQQQQQQQQQVPKEFLCPISQTLMNDPVVVPTGQTFERVSAQVCKDLNFTPILEDGSRPDFRTLSLIPNLALKSAIQNWCEGSRVVLQTPDYSLVENLVRTKMASSGQRIGLEEGVEEQDGILRVSERELLQGVADNSKNSKRVVIYDHAVSELTHRVSNRFDLSSSSSPETPLPFTVRPSCYYSSSSSSSDCVDSESIILNQSPNPIGNANPQESELVSKLKSVEVVEQEKGVLSLRSITKNHEEVRAALCTPRILSAIKPLLVSKYSTVQVNAVAAIVNLSLESSNKVKIVRSGIVPLLIEVLNGGFNESRDHAAGALFSLALEDENKMAIGALGAFPALLNALGSDREGTRDDSALALYHLTLVNTNRVKMVRLNVFPSLFDIVKEGGSLATRVLLILCNLAACNEGRSVMLDGNTVRLLVGLLKERDDKLTREYCVSALHALSHGNFRFRGLLKEVDAVEVLKEIEKKGSNRAREKAKRLLELLRERGDGEDENVDWKKMLESGEVGRDWYRLTYGVSNVRSPNST